MLDLSLYKNVEKVAFISFLKNYIASWMVTEPNLLNEFVEIGVCYLELLECVYVFEKRQNVRHIFCTAQMWFLYHKLNDYA